MMFCEVGAVHYPSTAAPRLLKSLLPKARHSTPTLPTLPLLYCILYWAHLGLSLYPDTAVVITRRGRSLVRVLL